VRGFYHGRSWSTSREEKCPWRIYAAVNIAGNVGSHIDVDFHSSSDNEPLEEVVRAPHERARSPAVVAALAMDPGLWLKMVNVKPPYLLDLEIV